MEVIGYHVAHFIAIECRVGTDALTLTAPPACPIGLDGRVVYAETLATTIFSL